MKKTPLERQTIAAAANVRASFLGFDWDLGTWDLVIFAASESPRTRRAYVAADVLIAIGLVVGLAVILTSAVVHERNAEAKLADSRAAVHLAEHVLLNLQHHQPMPATNHDMQLSIVPVVGGDAPAGFKWAEVRATVRGRERSLIGIVPDGATP